MAVECPNHICSWVGIRGPCEIRVQVLIANFSRIAELYRITFTEEPYDSADDFGP